MTTQNEATNISSLSSQWLKNKKISLKESSYVKYYTLIHNHILPRYGDIPLSILTDSMIMEDSMNMLGRGTSDLPAPYSEKTVRDVLVVLQSILNYGRDRYPDLIPSIKVTYPKNTIPEMHILTEFQQQSLVRVLYHNMDTCKLGILICLYMGLRIGEMCGLRWEDISLEEGTLTVKHTVQRLKVLSPAEDSESKTRLVIDSPKSTNSYRSIPIPDFLLPLLSQHAPKNRDVYIVTAHRTRYADPRTVQYRFKGYLREAGLPDMNFHSLRHNFATKCVELGFELKSLSEILGHSSVNITLNRYVHSSLALKKENMNKLHSFE